LFCPSATEWQTAQRRLKAAFPASASPAAYEDAGSSTAIAAASMVIGRIHPSSLIVPKGLGSPRRPGSPGDAILSAAAPFRPAAGWIIGEKNKIPRSDVV
jgi:hypothetical protein